MKAIDDLLRENLGRVYTAVSVEIRQKGATLYRAAFGTVDPDAKADGKAARTDTYFDLASVTKLFTATAFFRIVDTGRVSIDTRVCEILLEFTGQRPIKPYENPLSLGSYIDVVPPTNEMADAGAVTFEHLLTHSSGLPAWINLRNGDSVPDRLQMCLKSPFSYPTGTRVLYSDVGFILLGMAIEKLTDKPLDAAIKSLVLKPLDSTAHYGPITGGNVAPTEFCAWRQRRLVGEVHDENSATLNGVAGHAGLFGTSTDVASLGQMYLDGGSGLLSPRIVANATRPHIEDRGLGWMMRTVEGSSSGKYYSANSYGHTGFTGTSLWVDPQRELVCALLTNRVYLGRDPDEITRFRPLFHDRVIQALDGESGGNQE